MAGSIVSSFSSVWVLDPGMFGLLITDRKTVKLNDLAFTG